MSSRLLLPTRALRASAPALAGAMVAVLVLMPLVAAPRPDQTPPEIRVEKNVPARAD